jgi:hypothetical protein
MAKRKTKKIVNNSGGKRFAVIFFILFTATAGLGWWLFLSDSQSQTKSNALNKASLLVDRFDELSDAWKSRSGPGAGDKKAQKSDKTLTDTAPVKNTTKPVLAKENIIKPIKAQDTHDDVDPEDKKELRNLLRQLNDN